VKISQLSEGAANASHGSHLDLDDGAAHAHVSPQDNKDEDKAMPIETTDWRTRKTFWELRSVYMKDRHGDVDRDLEAYAVALADGHTHEEILDAAMTVTFSAIGKGGRYPDIPALAKLLASLPPPARIAA
jgi:hypothetical protein